MTAAVVDRRRPAGSRRAYDDASDQRVPRMMSAMPQDERDAGSHGRRHGAELRGPKCDAATSRPAPLVTIAQRRFFSASRALPA
jgi:hypothetical protein